MMNIRAFILIISMFSSYAVMAQKKTDPCIEQVRSMYRQLESISQVPKLEGKVFYISYDVKAVMKDSTNDGVARSTIEMWLSKKQMQLKSREMELYQDENDMFALLPQKKMIVRSDATPLSDDKLRRQRFSVIQDTLFALSTVKTCSRLKQEEAGADKLIVLELNEKGRQMLNTKTVSFYVNTAANELKKVKIEYDWQKASPEVYTDLAYVEYSINHYSFDYKKKKLETHVERIFMRSPKELVSTYAGYKLIDNRIKKNPIK